MKQDVEKAAELAVWMSGELERESRIRDVGDLGVFIALLLSLRGFIQAMCPPEMAKDLLDPLDMALDRAMLVLAKRPATKENVQ